MIENHDDASKNTCFCENNGDTKIMIKTKVFPIIPFFFS